MTEKELVSKIIEIKTKIDEKLQELEDLKAEFSKLEILLHEYVESKGIKATAKYDGIGSITIPEPQLFASISKENKDEAFKFLKSHNLNEFIEPNIHSRVLSREIKRLKEEGVEIPSCINIFNKKVIRINK